MIEFFYFTSKPVTSDFIPLNKKLFINIKFGYTVFELKNWIWQDRVQIRQSSFCQWSNVHLELVAVKTGKGWSALLFDREGVSLAGFPQYILDFFIDEIKVSIISLDKRQEIS